MAGAAGPDKTWCGFLLIIFHHSRGFAASGNQSLSFAGRFMSARCIFVVLARLAVCPPDLRFVSTQPNASLAGNLSGPFVVDQGYGEGACSPPNNRRWVPWAAGALGLGEFSYPRGFI